MVAIDRDASSDMFLTFASDTRGWTLTQKSGTCQVRVPDRHLRSRNGGGLTEGHSISAMPFEQGGDTLHKSQERTGHTPITCLRSAGSGRRRRT